MCDVLLLTYRQILYVPKHNYMEHKSNPINSDSHLHICCRALVVTQCCGVFYISLCKQIESREYNTYTSSSNYDHSAQLRVIIVTYQCSREPQHCSCFRQISYLQVHVWLIHYIAGNNTSHGISPRNEKNRKWLKQHRNYAPMKTYGEWYIYRNID